MASCRAYASTCRAQSSHGQGKFRILEWKVSRWRRKDLGSNFVSQSAQVTLMSLVLTTSAPVVLDPAAVEGYRQLVYFRSEG